MRIGVLGGTFDPVHLGHLVLAETAREQLALDLVLFSPAGQPWRKAHRVITPAEQRLGMLRLALEGSGFAISELEVDRDGPSYTADTLEELARQHAGAELFFVLGYDALLDLPNWSRPERILKLASLAVAARRPEDVDVASLGSTLPGRGERGVMLEMPYLEISSSDLRQRAREGRSLRFLVPPAVEAYIRENGLYRDTPAD
ncbi:MAG TPA: nicotinate-nucleotide adenylyltransferase [Dehalococcoidia bacterium]|nr:nicotinate-nucleotide adenylyltransferase [Dehalococcoidia bacterium]